MLVNKEQLLVDHLDHSLQGEELKQIEKLIREDQETSEQWTNLNLAVEAVQYSSLFDQVGTIKNTYLSSENLEAKPRQAVVRTMYRAVIRVAACILFLAGSFVVYKYATVSSAGIYEKYYSSFDLNTSRGGGSSDQLEQAYHNKNWARVITIFNKTREKSNKFYFLAGMAQMELKKYDQATVNFKQILDNNSRIADNYFQDEAEFYLAMSYLATNQDNLAIPILEKIKSDDKHLYNKVVSHISVVDLKFLQYKSHK